VQLQNGKRYALAEVLAPALFDRLLGENGIPADWTHALFDRDGRFIARSHSPKTMLGKYARPELIDAARREHTGQIRHQTWEGVDSYDVFSHTRWGNWVVAVAAPVAVIDGAGRRAAKIAAIGFLGALVLAGIAAGIFGRRLVGSLDRVAKASAMVGRGEIPPVSESSVTEIYELQRALHRAAELISRERASRHVAELERERLLEFEQQARLLAEEQGKAKDAFLAMLGHELRNPLSAISAGSALIQKAGSASEPVQRANEIIARQSAHLERIVDDLLDSARMLAGKITLLKIALNLGDAVRACVDAVRATGRLDGYIVQLHLLPLLVDADPARIDQIINNLLNNALKYTPAGGTIEITLREDAGQALLEVRDSGIGMQPALLERIFDPFVQGAVSLDRATGGLGIGLTLVKKLVELHGGTVSAQSAGERAGSCFAVRLPLLQERAVDTSPPVAPNCVPGTSVLLVEDNADARDMTAELLRWSGYKVAAVECGLQALQAVHGQCPTVAVIDIGLPDISGYDLARQLRLAPETRQMGLVALTEYGLASDVQTAMDAGFDVHLVKPVNHQRLIDAIERARASRQ
jgi:signal transduction histidine kinase/ActR/RegA family two-component response regulator